MSSAMRTMAALLFAGTVLFAQSTPCSVDGAVVNAVTHAPVVRAHLTVAGAGESWFADSDATGKWSIGKIECGQVMIGAKRPGYLVKTEPSRVVNVPLHDVRLELIPQSVISGRILDDQGDPLQSAQVTLMTSRVSNGLRALQPTVSMAADDRGEYRFAGLAAGKYLICASGESGFLFDVSTPNPFGEKCYPGPLGAGASTLEVVAGYEGRVDFTLTPLSTVTVRGVIAGLPQGTDAFVALGTASGRALPGSVGKGGAFAIHNVVPGPYTLLAASQPDEKLTAKIPVDVGSNGLDGIQLRLEPGVTLTGTVRVVAASGKKIDAPHVTLQLKASDGGNESSEDVGGPSFTRADVAPGSYRVEISTSPPLYVKGATMGDRDIIHSEVTIGPGATGIEIVLSDDGGAVEGDASTDDGSAEAWVYLGRDGAPSRSARTDGNGHFKIDTVPPGDYKVYAWDNGDNVEYANPEWMQRNGKGVAVTVAAGQTAIVKLVPQIAPPE